LKAGIDLPSIWSCGLIAGISTALSLFVGARSRAPPAEYGNGSQS